MKLTLANKDAIRYACLKFHYAKAVPCNTVGFNVYNDGGEWCGVIVYGTGACPQIARPYGLGQGEVLELVRVALNGKQKIGGCTSKAVAISIKLLWKYCPLCRLIVSYADCDQEHMGIIYQASNWIFTGTNCVGDSKSYLVDGKKIHSKTANDTCQRAGFPKITLENIRRAYHAKTCEYFVTKGKRKYIYPLDPKVREQVEKLRVPYPKVEECPKT